MIRFCYIVGCWLWYRKAAKEEELAPSHAAGSDSSVANRSVEESEERGDGGEEKEEVAGVEQASGERDLEDQKESSKELDRQEAVEESFERAASPIALIADELKLNITFRSFVNSGVNDLDVAFDWIFFHEVLGLVNRKTGMEETEGMESTDTEQLDYSYAIATGVFAAFGTILWLLVATDLLEWLRVWLVRCRTRKESPTYRQRSIKERLPSDGFSRPTKILILNMILEDLPQIILTSIIRAEVSSLSNAAVANIVTSGYSLLNKIVEACDEYGTRSSVPEMARVHRFLPVALKREADARTRFSRDKRILARLVAKWEGIEPRNEYERYMLVDPDPDPDYWRTMTSVYEANEPRFNHSIDLSTTRNLNSARLLLLLEALKKNDYIDGFDALYTGFDDSCARALVNAFQSSAKIRRLDLRMTGVSAQIVAPVLDNSALWTVDLAYNDIDDNGAIALANSIETNTDMQFRDLTLSNNNIGAEGARSLIRAWNSHSIENRIHGAIQLDNNNIDDRGAEAIAQEIQNSGPLKSLSLRNNKITNDGAFALIRALATNKTLETLWLSGNNIDTSAQGIVKKVGRTSIYYVDRY